MGQLREAYPRLQELGYRLVAISPDGPDKAAEFVQDVGLPFPVMSDEGLILTREFGIVFQAPEKDPDPVPAVYLVAADGTVLFQYVHPNYRIRLKAELLLAAARIGFEDEKKK